MNHDRRVESWDTESLSFREAVRAEDASALERLENEVIGALEGLGDRFGIGIGVADRLVNATGVLEEVKAELMEIIEEEAENDAKLKEEDELEEIKDLIEGNEEEEAAEETRQQDTPPTPQLVRGRGSLRSGGAA
jgi:hypothetical protein